MSDFMSKNYSGLVEAYASIYKQPESETTINEQVEQVDCEDVDYDPEVIVGVVVEHLVSNGYFNSEEQAFNMLPYLGDAWFNSILQNIVLEESFINDVNSVLDEGYDLSSHTWEELYEAYISHYQNLNEIAPAILAAPMAGPAIAAGLTGLVGGAAKLYQDMQRRKTDPASERWLKTGSYDAKPASKPVAKPAPKPNVYKAEVTSSENRPASSTPTGKTTSGVKVTTGGGGAGGGTPDPNKGPKKDDRPEWMKNFMKGLKGEKKPPSPLIQQAQQKAAEIAGAATRKAAKGALGFGVAGLVDQGLLGGIGGKVTRDIVKFGRSIGPGYEQLKREIKGEPAPAPTQPEAPKQKKLKFGPDGSVIGLE